MLCAAIDIGSNTTRVLVAEPEEGQLRKVMEQRAYTRIGKDVTRGDGRSRARSSRRSSTSSSPRSGSLRSLAPGRSGSSRRRRSGRRATARRSPARYRRHAESRSTSSPTTRRDASPSSARPRRSAIRSRARSPSSTSAADPRRFRWARSPTGVREVHSYPIGSGVLAEELIEGDPPGPVEIRKLRERIEDFFEGVELDHPDQAVAVGGSATSLRRLVGAVLEYETLERGVRVLTSDPAADVAKRFELDPRRVEVLASGVLLLEQFTQMLGQPLQIGKGGLREGVILEMLHDGSGEAVRRRLVTARAAAWLLDCASRLGTRLRPESRSYTVGHGQGARDSGPEHGAAYGEAAARVLEVRCEELLGHADNVLDVERIEGVHDMRVATRRLRAAIEVFWPCFPAEAPKAGAAEVKALADALGERRDRDVAIARSGSSPNRCPIPTGPGISLAGERVRGRAAGRERRPRPETSTPAQAGQPPRRVAAALAPRRPAEAGRRGGGEGEKVKKLDPAAPLAENAARIVLVRIEELRSFAPRALDPDAAEVQHDMRIAAKRLRYVLEATGFCFGRPAAAARRRAKEIQDLLGEVHDADVMLPRLARAPGRCATRTPQRCGRVPATPRTSSPGSPRGPRTAPPIAASRCSRSTCVARRALLFDRFAALWRESEERGRLARCSTAPPRARSPAPSRPAGSPSGPSAPARRSSRPNGAPEAAERATRAAAELAEAERCRRIVPRTSRVIHQLTAGLQVDNSAPARAMLQLNE